MNEQYKILCFAIVAITISAIQAQVALDEFYSYGSKHGDTALNPIDKDDGSSNPIELTQGFRYFNATHKSLWVNVNGAISFKQAIRTYTPTCQSMTSEFSMIAPYWGDVDLFFGGDIFYRETFEMSVLKKASHDIAAAFPEFNDVEVTWAFITTWLNVSHYVRKGCGKPQLRNTFQSVLASDGVHSFAIFYYNVIEWITGLYTQRSCPGVSGKPAKAGFDSGDGISFYNIPGSCTNDIITVNNNSNINELGKWVFRVDNENIRPAGCSNNFNSLLRTEPYFVDLYGHVPLRLSGPCLNASALLTCRFYDKAIGIIDMPGIAEGLPSDHQVMCMVPFLYKCGRFKLT